MGRQADPKAGKSLTIHAATPAEEEKIKAFKEIHARNTDLEIRATVMECVDRFLAKHNWPPGNSQTKLASFGAVKTLRCASYTGCNREVPYLNRTEYESGVIEDICDECLAKIRAKKCVKKVWGIVR